MYPNPNSSRRGSGRQRGQQPPGPPSPPLPLFVPPPGNREQETPPPLQLLEVMPWPSSVARRQAMEESRRRGEAMEFAQSSSGPVTPSSMGFSRSYLSPDEGQWQEQHQFRTEQAAHFSLRTPAVKRPYAEMSPPADETFRFRASLAELTNPSTSGTGRAVHRSRSRTRRPPPFDADYRPNTNPQPYGPGREHGIQPIPQQALPHFRFNGEPEERPDFHAARAARLRAMEIERMEVSASTEQDDGENM